MSRSYRKPWVVDNIWKRAGKRFAARRFRGLEATDKVGNNMNYKRHYEQYDLCDYKWYVSKDDESYDKVRRK